MTTPTPHHALTGPPARRRRDVALAAHLPARAPVTGSPKVWARDFGLASAILVGGVAAWEGAPLVLAAMLVGTAALYGAAAGGLAAPALEWSRRVVPFRWLWPGALLASAGWGAAVLVTFGLLAGAASLPVMAACGAAMGVAFLGWYWFAYTVATVLGWRRWPLLLGVAVTAAPAAELVDALFRLLG